MQGSYEQLTIGFEHRKIQAEMVDISIRMKLVFTATEGTYV